MVIVGDIAVVWAHDECFASVDDRMLKASAPPPPLPIELPKMTAVAAKTLVAAAAAVEVDRREFFLLRSLLFIGVIMFSYGSR